MEHDDQFMAVDDKVFFLFILADLINKANTT